MAKLPKRITFDMRERVLKIDGEPFPWYIHEQGPHIETLGDGGRTELGVILVPILTDQVEVIPPDDQAPGHVRGTSIDNLD